MSIAFVEFDTKQERIDAVVCPARMIAICGPRSPPFAEERACILKGVARDLPGDDAPGGQRLAVAGLHAADLARRYGQEFDQFNFELQRPQAKMQPGCQRVCLVAGFTMQGDDAAVGQVTMSAEQGEFLGYDTDAVVGNQNDAAQPENLPVGERQQNDADYNNQLCMCEPEIN